MAHYSYKDLCYSIPSHIEERFKEETGREPDGDPGYDGDYWSLAAMWVEELESDNATMRAILKSALAGEDVTDRVTSFLAEENQR